MTDDKTESFDDAESAATHGSSEGQASEALPAIDRDWDLSGEALAGIHPADHHDAPGYVVDDPEAEELTDTSAPSDVDVDGVDDEHQLDAATAAAASARSARPVRRATPLADATTTVGDTQSSDAAGTPTPAGGATAASRRPSRSARPVRRATPLPVPDDEPVVEAVPAAGESLQQEVGGVSPLAPAAAALGADRSALRPRRRPAADELDTADQPARPSRRDADHETHRRVGPVEFVRQSAAELRKVIWPTGEELGQYFVVVLAFVLFIIAFVGLLDLFFGWGLLKLFGTK